MSTMPSSHMVNDSTFNHHHSHFKALPPKRALQKATQSKSTKNKNVPNKKQGQAQMSASISQGIFRRTYRDKNTTKDRSTQKRSSSVVQKLKTQTNQEDSAEKSSRKRINKSQLKNENKPVFKLQKVSQEDKKKGRREPVRQKSTHKAKAEKQVVHHNTRNYSQVQSRIDMGVISRLQHITAKQFSVLSREDGVQVVAKQAYLARECASLTKIMTAQVTMALMTRLNLPLEHTYFHVNSYCASIIGTSATLEAESWVSVLDLLYGMMLPSGNDAAQVLACNLGPILGLSPSQIQAASLSYSALFPCQDLSQQDPRRFIQVDKKDSKAFIEQMNIEAKRLELKSTNFNNPHGLQDGKNFSSAFDMARLSHTVLKNEVLSKVVSTKEHECVFVSASGENERLFWENTNKMLGKAGWVGVKTGITFKAGPCLSSANGRFIVVILNSASMDARWAETQILSDYASKNL